MMCSPHPWLCLDLCADFVQLPVFVKQAQKRVGCECLIRSISISMTVVRKHIGVCVWFWGTVSKQTVRSVKALFLVSDPV